MVPLTCPETDELRRLLLGHLSTDEAEPLEEHVTQCERCLETVRALQLTDPFLDVVRAGARAPGVHGEAAAEEMRERLRDVLDTTVPGPTQAPLGPPQLPGEIGRIGPYRVLEVLGSGGMGIVYLAEQTRPRRRVALKMSLVRPHGGRERQTRLESETAIIARLQHPHIVPIYEVGEWLAEDSTPVPYFTMEHLAGGNLAQKLAVAPLPPRDAAQLAETLARTVHFAHEHGVIHRDLKPSNVLLTAAGVPKITDFGLAKQLQADAEAIARTRSGVLVGTPAYMAPEQVGGSRNEIGPACDVYALGAILYETLTGRPPFRAATLLETLEQVRNAEPVPPVRLQPGVPRDLQTICLKCLAKEPARRYRTAHELADDLGRFLRGEPIQARPVPAWERTWKWARRNLALAALLLVCLLSLVTLVAGVLVHAAQLSAEVKRTEKQRQRAEAEKTEAERKQQLAVHRYHLGHLTISLMVTRGHGLRAEDLWRLQKLHEDRLEFFREIQGADDLEIHKDMALAFLQYGAFLSQLKQNGSAAEHIRGAIALLEELPEEFRSQPDSQDLRAECYIHLAELLGQQDQKEQAYRQVLAIRKRLAEADPENRLWQAGLARAELLVGKVDQQASRWTEAEAHYTRGQSLYARLADADAGDETFRGQLANAWVSLGQLYHRTRRPNQAGPAFARAEELLAPLAATHPEEPMHALSLAGLYTVWSNFLTETGQPEAGRQRASRAVDLTGPLLRNETLQGITHPLAREALVKRAMACAALARWADAVKDWDQVVELDEAPQLWPRRLRAKALARAGEYARAVAEVQALAKELGLSAEDIRELACVCAESVEPARADTRLPNTERTALAERCGSQAVLLLAKLNGQGYFKDADHARWLSTGPELRPLRDRIDFWLVRQAARRK